MTAEQERLYKRFSELAQRSVKTGRSAFTRFLEPSEEAMALESAHRAGARCVFYGGCEEAERRMAAFYDADAPEEWEYPIVRLKISWNGKFSQIGHRDLLGAAMALGLERQAMGDIILGEGDFAYLFAMEDIAPYIAANFTSAGRASISAAEDHEPMAIRPPAGRNVGITVAQLRFDAVAAHGMNISRGDAQSIIAQGMAKLNHQVCLKPGQIVKEGDLISLRGHGRMRVLNIKGETKKGRIALNVFRYEG